MRPDAPPLVYNELPESCRALEIGSGGNPQPGYYHVDAYEDSHSAGKLDMVCDARALPFPDGRFDSVLMFGVFEHFGYSEAQEALLEVSRVLSSGGVFKFDVPDFEWFIHAYRTGTDRTTGAHLGAHRDRNWIMHAIFGGQDGPGQFHRWGWDYDSIHQFLKKPNWGFSEVRLVGRRWRDPEENHLIWECVKR